MNNVRVCCPECKHAFPIPIEAREFSCPHCGRSIHIVPTGKTLGWYIDPGPDFYQAQVIRPIPELLAGNPRGRGTRAEGAARARRLIREQRKLNSHFKPAPLLASLLFLCSLLSWYMFHPVAGIASAGNLIPVTGQNAQLTPLASPTLFATHISLKASSPSPTATPLPTATATALPALLIQATARQAALDQAVATSYAQETANASRYQATQTAISVRFTEVVGARQESATQTAQAKNHP